MLIRKELVFLLKAFVYITYPIVLLGTVLVVCALVFGQTSTEREASRVETIIVGGDIIEAVEEYRSNHSQYPHSLEELAPTYLQRITQPSWGDSGWLYKKLQADFELQVGFDCGGEILYPVIFYTSSSGRWYVDQ
jgi:hypothetical protein